jgi:hypothetical protein
MSFQSINNGLPALFLYFFNLALYKSFPNGYNDKDNENAMTGTVA